MPVNWKGGDPEVAIANLKKKYTITSRAAQFAVDRQMARMLKRTDPGTGGVDVNGAPFEPYGETGPYYYNPNANDKAEIFGAGALARIRSGKSTFKSEAEKRQLSSLSRLQKKIGGTISRSRKSLKFASYGAFKRALGRSGVDLRGPRAPHMLQAVISKVEHAARQMIIGVYDREKAKLARIHNTGSGVPKRRWFAASRKELKDMISDIAQFSKFSRVGK